MDNKQNFPADNRNEIDDLLEISLQWARRGRDRSVTVIAIELDDLETLRADPRIPGAHGLLADMSARLAKMQNVACVLAGDTIVLVSTAPRSLFDAFSLADRAARTIARPVVVDAFELTLTASIGVCLSRSGLCDAQTLLRDARFTLAEAKQRGRGEIVVFSPELHRRRVATQHEITMQFEPVVSLDDGRVTTYEASVIGGSTPGFGDADAAALEFLLDQVGRTMTTWPIDVDASFNVSPAQLGDPRFLRRVRAASDRYSLEHGRFGFEIHEAEVSEDLRSMQHTMTRLRDDGWRVGIDGFGGATSLLSTLARLPVRFVKIDRALVEEADPKMWDLLTVSEAAHSLQIATIATSVGTLPELALAIAHEYDYAQGPLFGIQQSAPPAPRH